MCVFVCVWRWKWRRKGDLGKAKGQKRKVSHIIHTGPRVYFWVPEGIVHPNAHTPDGDFSLTRRKTLEHTIRSCSASI